MALDLSSTTMPAGGQHVETVTLASASAALEVTLPSWCRTLTVELVSAAGYWSHTGTDGSALGAGNRFRLPADTAYAVRFWGPTQTGETPTVYVEADAAGTELCLHLSAYEAP